MILKHYEIKKINSNQKIVLFFGKNNGLKELAVKEFINDQQSVQYYDQNEVLEREENFLEEIYSHSFFEKKKIIIIKRVNDKLTIILEKIDLNKLDETRIILISDNLEKKSKLRSKFEKEKNFICIAFYPDTNQILIKLAFNFFKEKNISISPSLINLIISKINEDRKTLFNELNKLELYSLSGKSLNEETVNKLINLNENHEINALTNNYLIQNQKKVISILNENTFSNEDCIIIVRNLLNKCKKILNLSNEYSINQNIDATIAASKPPIFWKEKEIVKQQIYKWKPEEIKNLIYQLNKIEFSLKKNINVSIKIITDFLLTKKVFKN